MTITQIKYFLEAAKSLSFTRAAEKNFTSQQVISKHIHLLEESLNIKLFDKNGKKIKLTPAGQLLFETWNRHSRESQAAISQATLMSNSSNTIQIGVLDLRYVIDLVIPKIQVLADHFPNIEFKYFLGNFATIQHAMENGHIDLAVTLSTELPDYIKGSNIMKIQDINLGIFMNQNHPLASRNTVTVGDLSEETFYIFDENLSHESEKKIITDCRLHGFEPAKIEYFTSLHSLEFALISGGGINIGFDIFFQDPAHNLKMYPLESMSEENPTSLVAAWESPYLENIAEYFVK